MFLLTAAVSLNGRQRSADLMYVKVSGDDCWISAKMDRETDILYWFRKCMANGLFTFYRVGIVSDTSALSVETPYMKPDKILNLASSDNIGPFLITGYGWCGGNHLDQAGNMTADCVSWYIRLDGKLVSGDVEGRFSKVEIGVENLLGDSFAEENVRYRVCGSEIDVECRLRFLVTSPVNVERYYGMQSMFVGETETLTPGGKYSEWTPEREVNTFSVEDYPKFREFIESDGEYCQRALLYRKGLGNHKFISSGGPVFIGNSWSKSYHCLMIGHTVKPGDRTVWRGTYSWYRRN